MTIANNNDQYTHVNATNLLLENALVLNPAQKAPQTAHIMIKNGVIEEICADKPSVDASFETIDLQGAWVTPHFVDLGTQLREPGYEHKGSLLQETLAAFNAGFSDVAMLPDTMPVLDTPAVLGLIQERAKNCPVNIWAIGAMTTGLEGKQLSEIFALKDAGVVAVTQSRSPIRDNRLALRCLEYIATTGLKVFFYSEDYELAGDGCAHEGPIADRLGLPGIPACAETTAIARDLLLVERTGIEAHFGHISCAGSVELIKQAQAKGLKVTADVALAHLAFDERCLLGFNSQFRLEPPLRSINDRKALLDAVNSGVLSVSIGHQPQDIAAKTAPFSEAAEGMSLYDTHISLAKALIAAGDLDPLAWVRALTTQPAAIIGRQVTGINVGDVAALNVIGDHTWTPNKSNCHSSGGNIFGFRQEQVGKLTHRISGTAE